MFLVNEACKQLIMFLKRFKKARVIAPLYTGGPVAATPDGSRLVTCVGEEAILTDVAEGREICRFAGVRSTFLIARRRC